MSGRSVSVVARKTILDDGGAVKAVSVFLAATVAGAGLVAGAAPAQASINGPEPVSTWLSPVRPNTPTWVHIVWMAGKKICRVKVTAAADRVTIGYPANTGDYTSFGQSDSLPSRKVDFTAIRVDADRTAPAYVPISALVSYTSCGTYAKARTETFTLYLPVLDQ
jgi:hypothetical protein